MQFELSEELAKQVAENKAKLVVKEGWFWTTLHYIVMVVTFGGNRTFKDGFITTLGPIIGVPESWRAVDGKIYVEGPYEATILHELVHIDQFRKFGLGSRWLGILPMFFLYALLPLPLGFAWGRWVFEREAYAVTLRWYKEHRVWEYKARLDRVVYVMTGPLYGWTLAPFPFVKRYVRKWFEENV
jgi:hypothetical protein